MMKQPHTEQAVEHTDGEQNTGNHRGGMAERGGRRTGAANVEGSDKDSSIESATDVDRVPSLDGSSPGSKKTESRERSPERDEHGRM